jgi:hypothetical protein
LNENRQWSNLSRLRQYAGSGAERNFGWQRYSVVLDVPKDATGVFFGVLLSGTGKVWINSGSLERVGDEVPTTAVSSKPVRPEAPANLDFEN